MKNDPILVSSPSGRSAIVANRRRVSFLVSIWLVAIPGLPATSDTHKPVLHGRHWVAITGKPAGAVAGAKMFERGGNAIDASCAMLAVVCTMFDDVSWGGETQALIFDPIRKKVIGINALGVAPTGATPSFFKAKQMRYPPGVGPLAAVTPGNPGGLMVMLAEFGTLSLSDVLAPALEMAEGYPIESELVGKIEQHRETLGQWPYSKQVFLSYGRQAREAPQPGEIFRQPDLHRTLVKLVETEAAARQAGQDRKQAIYSAYNRFYCGDIAEELVRATREHGGLLTQADLAQWQVKIEDPVMTTYHGIQVYKLTCWTQGPVMLQALNLLESLDLAAMGYNSTRYIHTLYQVMNLAYADRDFYYGDPDFPPEEPLRGLLSKEYAAERLRHLDWHTNHPGVGPGDPYPYEGKTNPFSHYLQSSKASPSARLKVTLPERRTNDRQRRESFGKSSLISPDFWAGTTSIQAADAQGWVVSVTPSGGWIPVYLAGKTGIGLSQRMQSFVLEEAENPFNVLAPGKRPRVTLTPTLALKEGRPFLCFSVQGGDTQDQNLLQFFLNVVEFGMNVQTACEAANITSYQMHSSFGDHESIPGRLTVRDDVPSWVQDELWQKGYQLERQKRTSGPITAIFFDTAHGTFWGGASNYGEDYGVAW